MRRVVIVEWTQDREWQLREALQGTRGVYRSDHPVFTDFGIDPSRVEDMRIRFEHGTIEVGIKVDG